MFYSKYNNRWLRGKLIHALHIYRIKVLVIRTKTPFSMTDTSAPQPGHTAGFICADN